MGLTQYFQNEISMFLDYHGDATVFMTPEFTIQLTEVFGFDFRYLTSRDDSGKLRGVLPLFFVNSIFFGRRMVTLPFNFFGGCAADSIDAATDLLKQVRALAGPYLFCEIKGFNPLPQALVCRHDLKHRREFLTYEIPLTDEEDLLARRKRRFREKIVSLRKRLDGRASIERVHEKKGLREFYGILARQYLRQHLMIPLPFRLYKSVWDKFGKKGMCDLFLLRMQGKAVAGAFFLYHGGRMLYQWGAFDTTTGWFSPLALLLDEAMRVGIREGREVFDMGLTSASHKGLRFFKSRWGAEEKWLDYYYLLSQTEKTPDLNYHSSYGRTRNILRFMPVWAVHLVPAKMFGHLA